MLNVSCIGHAHKRIASLETSVPVSCILRVWRRMVTLELVRLLKPDRITAVDCTAAHDGGINTDIDLVVLRRRA